LIQATPLCRANASRLGLDVRVFVGDLLSGVGRVDAVLANLPYVEDDAALPPDVVRFEPSGALFGGPDGLDLVRRLIAQASAPLLAFEIAPEQACAVAGLMGDAGYARVEVLRDLAGRERVVVGREDGP